MVNRFYTGIGSRESPQEVRDLMTRLAYVMAVMGHHGRSGSADGADLAFERGWYLAYRDGVAKGGFTGFLPWEGFNGRRTDHYHKVTGNDKFARAIASDIHPAWHKTRKDKFGNNVPIFSEGVKALHTRNIHQILGETRDKPSRVVFFYAIPNKDGITVKGGTNTAVQLALQEGCSVQNLWYPDVFQNVLEFVLRKEKQYELQKNEMYPLS